MSRFSYATTNRPGRTQHITLTASSAGALCGVSVDYIRPEPIAGRYRICRYCQKRRGEVASVIARLHWRGELL